MKIVMIELSTEQEAAIKRMKELHGQWWANELLASWRTGDYSFQVTGYQVAALENLKATIGSSEKESVLANLKYADGEIEPIVQEMP